MSHKQPSLKHIRDTARFIKEVAEEQDAIIRQMWEVTQAMADGHFTSSMMAQAKQIVDSPVTQGIIRGMAAPVSLRDIAEQNEGIVPLAEVAKMFGETEEEFKRELEESHAQIEAGQGVDVTEELLAWEQGRMELSFFVLDVLRLQEEYECFGEPIFWRTTGSHAPITFFVLCGSLFYWATADAEKITPEDLPALRQAIRDVEATGAYELRIDRFETGCELWCARKRGMRPQQPAYPKDARLQALFDACGPARSPAEEG